MDTDQTCKRVCVLSRSEALAATLRQVFEFGLYMDLFPRVSMDAGNN